MILQNIGLSLKSQIFKLLALITKQFCHILTDNASSNKKVASFTRRLMNLKNRGASGSSIWASAYCDNSCQKQ